MAALPPPVLVGMPRNPQPVPARVRARALNPGRNTFWMRQVFVDNPPNGYVSVDNIMDALPLLQELLITQLPFMAKVVMRVQLSEESFDPIDGEREVVYSERRFATVPMLVRPLADPAERLQRYVVSGSRRTLEDRLEHARFNNSQQKLEGIIDLQIFTSPSRELAQLPAAPGGAFEGGCWKDLPELLKNGDHKCFRYCVMAHLLGCATWGRKYRQDAAERHEGLALEDHGAVELEDSDAQVIHDELQVAKVHGLFHVHAQVRDQLRRLRNRLSRMDERLGVRTELRLLHRHLADRSPIY